MVYITIISAIASIFGACCAWRQANKAKDSAEEAKRARSQMIDHRKTSELSIIQASCKKALNTMKKYGPASSPSHFTGAISENDSKDVQDFIFLLKEHRAYFGNKSRNEADEFCDALTPLLVKFSSSSSSEDLQNYGKLIVTHLSSITAAIKKHLDRKLNTVH
jgi:hypothetical protein